MPTQSSINPKIFKAYDIRALYPEEINEEAAYKIAKAYAAWLKPKKVALGYDVRTSSKPLFEEVKRGLTEMGVEVFDVGLITSDMIVFATGNYNLDGGIVVTASHNPAEYNGMKLYRENAAPISIDSGLAEIRDIAMRHSESGNRPDEKSKDPSADASRMTRKGKVTKLEIKEDYLKKVFSLVDTEEIKPMKVVVNPNFGAAGEMIEQIAQKLNLELVKLNFESDGTFPKGQPDPSQLENQKETGELARKSGAAFAAMWDADADRCLFLDENGEFVMGCYATAILAEAMLDQHPKSKIVFDTTLIWPAIDRVKAAGGVPLVNKVGHSFITERMIEEDAIFGGETSGHFYFKDLWFCDNGMVPFLLMLKKLSTSGKKMSDLADYLRNKYPNGFKLIRKEEGIPEKLKEIEERYADAKIEHIDGVSVEYPDWRFNARASNTEPLLKVFLEAKSQKLVDEKLKEVVDLIEN